MAEKRMFTGKITESDAFLDMPLTSQCLYFHLCMYADDEGFVKNPKRIQRMIGATDDDLRVLIGKNFLINYETGVIVIKHWKMHNAIRKDRLHDSEYIEEKSMLYIKENGAYTLDPTQGVPLLSTKCQTSDSEMSTKCQPNVGIDKIRLDKNRLDKDSIDKNNNIPKPQKHKYGEYNHVLLTDEERDKLMNEYGEQETLEAITFLDEYIEMKGYKAKSHYLCMRKWVFDAVNRQKPSNKNSIDWENI